MYIKIVKKFDIKYDKLKKYLYNLRDNIDVISRFVPIKYLNTYFLMTPLNSLDGLFLEKNIKKIKVNIIYEDIREILKLNKIGCVYDDDYNPNELYDCYFDIYQNLLFIRITDFKNNYIGLEFMELNNYNILECFSQNQDNLELKINPSNNLENIDIQIENEYKWEEKFVIFPEVPYNKFKISNNFIINGTEIIRKDINTNLSTLFGIISNCEFDEDSGKYEYSSIPIFAILKSLKMIFDCKYLLFNIDLGIQPLFNIGYKNTEVNCLVNDETLYNIYETIDYDGNNLTITTKLLDKNTLIYQIDGYQIDSNGYLNLKKKIPIKSYIWYFKELDLDNCYKLKYDKLIINQENLNTKILEHEIKIHNNINIGINLSNFYYINYKNKFIFELNESLLFLMKEFLFEDDTYKNFINYIIKNKYKKKKIVIGLEFLPDTIKFGDDLKGSEDNINLNNFEIKIIDNSIQVRPKIFLIKKYNSFQ